MSSSRVPSPTVHPSWSFPIRISLLITVFHLDDFIGHWRHFEFGS
jgi:hypothetical protein